MAIGLKFYLEENEAPFYILGTSATLVGAKKALRAACAHPCCM